VIAYVKYGLNNSFPCYMNFKARGAWKTSV